MKTFLLALIALTALHTSAAAGSANFPKLLSELRAVSFNPQTQSMETLSGFAYSLQSPLYSDGASKFRTIVLPAGTKMKYTSMFSCGFPEGSLITKTFSFTDKFGRTAPIETRVLWKGDQWYAAAYVWNSDHSDAELNLVGTSVAVEAWVEGEVRQFTYGVPSVHACISCHGANAGPDQFPAMRPIGVQARQLNGAFAEGKAGTNQLTALSEAGQLAGLPSLSEVPKATDWRDPQSGTPDARARDYLDMNCVHCHNPHGNAANTGFFPAHFVSDKTILGFCKPPVSAANAVGPAKYDVVPGKPKKSLVIWRMSSNRRDTKMPELGRSMPHQLGIDLVSNWISGLRGRCP